ncbi:MAG: ABC transporter ATP-binding protein [Candidatus Delongbacteria bacterium]|nr:ABC transporter ATP-binding protein [Candidatus Delongbacteria bacterium]MBN2834897.1 ABC transporter ATP-binding protein [Candidatus Delongbacteria bacterium]
MNLIFSFITNSIKNYKKFYVINIILTITGALLQIFIPIIYKEYIDKISSNNFDVKIAESLLLFFVLLFLYNINSILWHFISTKFGVYILFDLRKKIMKKLQYMEYQKILDLTQEKIKHILFYDTLEVFRTVINFSVNFFSYMIIITGVMIIISQIDSMLFLFMLFLAFVGIVSSNFSRKYIRRSSAKVNNEFKRTSLFTNQFVDNIETVKTSNIINHLFDKLDRLSSDFMIIALRNDFIQVFFKKIIENLNYIFSIAVISYLFIIRKNVDAGDIVLILFYTNLILKYIQELEVLISSIGNAIPSLEHVYSILNSNTNNNSHLTWAILDSIALQNINFSYKDKQILKDINFDFKNGDIIKVIGNNGSGKTTFLKLVSGLLVQSCGKYLINNVCFDEYNSDFIREKILYIGQISPDFDMTIEEYCEIFYNRKLNDKTIIELLNELDFFEDSSNVEKDILNQFINTLSGGQKKKLEIIKLILNFKNSDIIIIDEVDSSLDSSSLVKYEKIKEDLFVNSKDKIIFEISHRNENSTYYTRIIEL